MQRILKRNYFMLCCDFASCCAVTVLHVVKRFCSMLCDDDANIVQQLYSQGLLESPHPIVLGIYSIAPPPDLHFICFLD